MLSAAVLAEKRHKEIIEADDVLMAIEEEKRIGEIKNLEALRRKLLKLKKKYQKR